MRDVTDFRVFVLESGLDLRVVELLEIYVSVLPDRQDVFSDQWDVISWIPRPGNYKEWVIKFDSFKNLGLKLLVKLYVLSKRFSKKIYGETATGYICAIFYLDAQLSDKAIDELTAEDFYAVETFLKGRSESGSIMYLRTLQAFSNWLRKNFFPLLEYTAPKLDRIAYGRGGTDQGRAGKLLPDEVVSQLFSIAKDPGLDSKNKFYLNALILTTVMQGRINELATLPVDCLIEMSDSIVIKVFSEKGGVLGIRHFPQVIAPAVKEAFSYIRSVTEDGRALIRELKNNPPLDWRLIVSDDVAFRYFTGKFVAEWTEKCRLVDGNAVWSASLGCVIDAIDVLRQCQGSYRLACSSVNVSDAHFRHLVAKQEGARHGRYMVCSSGVLRVIDSSDRLWKSLVRKNPLAIGVRRMEEVLQITLYQHLDKISDILDEGLQCQMEGNVYPEPECDPRLEQTFRKKILPVVTDRSGTPMLEAENSLFVVPRNLLNSNKTRSNQYQLISDEIFSLWLYEQCASNDYLFRKYDVRDPRTGDIADFTWHDIRHWLQTVLKRGGLTDAQASLLAGRKDISQMQVYDQIPALLRSEQLAKMRDGIRGGVILGNTTEAYSKLRVQSSDLAEEFLIASTLVVNWMPHGGCTLNLALTPCIHNLSCFSSTKNGELCNHLQVDLRNVNQFQEVERLQKHALKMLRTIEEMDGISSPQYEHYGRVARNTTKLLGGGSYDFVSGVNKPGK